MHAKMQTHSLVDMRQKGRLARECKLTCKHTGTHTCEHASFARAYAENSQGNALNKHAWCIDTCLMHVIPHRAQRPHLVPVSFTENYHTKCKCCPPLFHHRFTLHVQSYTVSLTRPLRTLSYIYVYIYYTHVCSINTDIGMYMYTCEIVYCNII